MNAPMKTRPLNLLFATWEGGGSVPPVLTAAEKMIARGHRVRIMSEACNRPEVEAVGARFVGGPARRADRTSPATTMSRATGRRSGPRASSALSRRS